MHRTPADKSGWSFGILDYSPPRVVYCRSVITRGGDSSGCKRVLLPYSRHPDSEGSDTTDVVGARR